MEVKMEVCECGCVEFIVLYVDDGRIHLLVMCPECGDQVSDIWLAPANARG